MDKVYYEFVSYPYDCEQKTSPNVTVRYTIHERDINLPDMMEAFKQFLYACGYPEIEEE